MAASFFSGSKGRCAMYFLAVHKMVSSEATCSSTERERERERGMQAVVSDAQAAAGHGVMV